MAFSREKGEPNGPPLMDEVGWLARARQGDESAWEPLVRRYQEPVFRLAYLIVGDAADAEEIAQDAFTRAYLSLDKFDRSRPLRPWLLQITRNLARNRRRGLGRYWAAIQRWRQQLPAASAFLPEADEAAWLRQAVGRLPPVARDIIYLRYFLDMSVAETAATLGVAEGTVKSRLSRALPDLRRLMEAEQIGTDES